MTETESLRKLDLASLALLVCGLVFGLVSIWLISRGVSLLIAYPSVGAIATGATHLTKLEAPRT